MTDSFAFSESVRTFSDTKLQAQVASWSLGNSPSASLYRHAGEIGLTGIEIPSEHGGLSFGYKTKLQACADLAAQDFGFAMSVINSHNVALRLCKSAPSSVTQRYLPALLAGESKSCTALTEPGTGSDVAAIQTRAKREGNHWVIDGHKSWIVNARCADTAVVFAQTKAVGKPDGIAAFLVDLNLPGAERYPIDSGISQISMGTGGFRLNDVVVDDECLLLDAGTAFKSILDEINGARVYVAAMCDAMVGKALQQVDEYGARRYTFSKALKSHSSWNQILDDARRDLLNSKALTAHGCEQVDSQQDAQISAIRAKINSVENAQHHLPRLLHAMGAEGLRPEYCFTRHLGAVQLAGLTDGATNMLKDRLETLSRRV